MNFAPRKATTSSKKYLHQMKVPSKRESTTSVDDDTDPEIYEQENFVILRLPLDVAEKVRDILEKEKNGHAGTKLAVNFLQSDLRRAVIRFDKRQFKAKLVDLPCIIEVLKTLDRKNFYKVADMGQMLVCEIDNENKPEPEKEKSDKRKEKQYQWAHGITPPLKNVRKRRFRKTLKKKYIDAPELDKELKRLLRADLEAAHVRYEVITEDQEKVRIEDGEEVCAAGEIDQTSRKMSSLPKPPEFSSFSHFNVPHESDVFGGQVSSSSSEDGEGGAMARELLAGTVAATSAAHSIEIPDDLKTDLIVSEAELNEIIREKQDLEMQVTSLDNVALKEKMYSEIKRLSAEEAAKREELLSLREQTGLK